MENFKETEQIEQEETLPPQPSPKKKYLLIGVITAITVLVGGIGIFVLLIQKEASSQVSEAINADVISKDEITNWRNYTNEFDGFSIKYPPDWYLVTYQLGDLGIPASIEMRPLLTPGREGGNGLIITATPFERSLNEAQQEVVPTPLPQEYAKFTNVAVEDIVFYGEQAKRIDISYKVATPARNARNILVKHGGKLYGLSYGNTTDEDFSDTVEKMLTTFKFGNAPLEKFSLILTDLKTGGVKNRLRTVARGLDLYFHDRGFYPRADGEKIYYLTRENVSTRGGVLRILVEEGYISHIPQIDNLSQATFYEYTSDGTTYELAVQLDNSLDPQCTMEEDLCMYRIRDGRVVSNK